MTNEKYNELLQEAAMALFHALIKSYPPMPINAENMMLACARKAKAFIDEIEKLSKTNP